MKTRYNGSFNALFCAAMLVYIVIAEIPRSCSFAVQKWPNIWTLLGRSPAYLTSDDFVRSNEFIRTKWLIY